MRLTLLLLASLLASSAVSAQHAVETGPVGEFVFDDALYIEGIVHSLSSSLQLPHQWQEQLEEASSLEETARLIVAYFATKNPEPNLFYTRYTPPDVLQRAEGLLQDQVVLLETEGSLQRGDDGRIDWHDRGPRGDKEWAWMLNRHSLLLELEYAYRTTGNSAYADQLNALFTDWVLSNRYPDRLTFSAPWRALEVARRILRVWPFLFFHSDALSPQNRILLLASLRDHADALYEHPSFWGGNHLITEKIALLTLASLWPEFKEAEAWKTDAIHSLSREFISQSYPDGSYHELSNHYQRVVLANASHFVRLLHPDGVIDRSSTVIQRIEHMWDFFAGATRPDGYGPMNNASDLERNSAWLLDAAELFQREDWRAIATSGKEGAFDGLPPSRFFPWAGQVFLRTGWTPESSWLYLDAGPYGSAHQHQDQLHVSLVLKGQSILTDSGRYTYQPGKWKSFFTGPEAHSSLIVNGKAPKELPFVVSQPLPVDFDSTRMVASAQAAFPRSFAALEGPVRWIRKVQLLGPSHTAVITDTVITYRPTELTFSWPLHPDINEWPQEAFLSLSSQPEVPVEMIRRPSWIAPEYHQRIESTRLSISCSIRQPTTFTWVWSLPDALRDPTQSSQ
jgi:hypothetical protein